jgi:hypothetical protein
MSFVLFRRLNLPQFAFRRLDGAQTPLAQAGAAAKRRI